MGACNSTSNTKPKTEPHKTSTEPSKSKATPNVAQRPPEPQPKIEEQKLISLHITQDGETLLDGQFDGSTQLKEIYAKLNLKPLWDYDIIDDIIRSYTHLKMGNEYTVESFGYVGKRRKKKSDSQHYHFPAAGSGGGRTADGNDYGEKADRRGG